MAFENYNIRQFKRAMFNKDFSEMSEEEFKIVHNEYVDAAGLYDEEELDATSYVFFLNSRINSIRVAIVLQRKFIDNFGVPYLPNLEMFKKFGHNLFFNKGVEDFLRQLKRIELKEKKYETKLEESVNELVETRSKKEKKEYSVKQTREAFIRTINSLGKLGYKIDNETTTVEELAYMIKQQFEESKR